MNNGIIAIIGSDGFVGNALISESIKQSKTVIGIDRMSVYIINSQRVVDKFAKPKDVFEYLEQHEKQCPGVMICSIGDNSIKKHSIYLSKAEFENQIEENLTNVFCYVQEYAKCCIRNKVNGSIVLLSSIGGSVSHREMCAYDASKAGIESLCRSLTLDYAIYGININAIAIGPIENSKSSKEDNEKREELRKLIPSRQYPNVADVAKWIVLFAINTPTFITGQTIKIDGGLSCQLRPLSVERVNDRDVYEGYLRL